MLGRHCILNRLQLWGIELDDLSAFGTDHVIVMLVFVVMFVVRAPISKANLTCEPRLSK